MVTALLEYLNLLAVFLWAYIYANSVYDHSISFAGKIGTALFLSSSTANLYQSYIMELSHLL